MESRQTESELTRELDKEIEQVKRNETWRREYMKSILYWQEERQEAREEGREEGLREGREEGRQQGREEGRQQGREEGRQQGREEGRQQGREEGRTEGIKAYIELCQEMGLSKKQAFHKIQEKLNLTDKTAKDSLEKYWKA